ncbi:CKLF-like MARVEL transmembrane domain-containing protein 5 isoform X3 [Hyperolius riggenbachi]|uniref:CKLF-like MARVEL transmembrane domain-containing protein 5 isoform X3 n=1 Tax=Hyperolius riggenbachi TaxID=752182 RepID=UPI0035A3637E
MRADSEEPILREEPEFPSLVSGDRHKLRHQVLCFVIFICFAASISSYLAAPLIELLIILIFLIIYSSHYHERLTALNWPCTDFLRCVSAALIFLVVSIVAAARSSGEGGAITAASGIRRGTCSKLIVEQKSWMDFHLLASGRLQATWREYQ